MKYLHKTPNFPKYKFCVFVTDWLYNSWDYRTDSNNNNSNDKNNREREGWHYSPDTPVPKNRRNKWQDRDNGCCHGPYIIIIYESFINTLLVNVKGIGFYWWWRQRRGMREESSWTGLMFRIILTVHKVPYEVLKD